jgi:hypothetical protein
MTKKFNIIYLLLLVLAMTFTSCSSLDEDETTLSTCFDIAVYGGATDNGTVFTLRQSDDSQLVTLTSSTKIELTGLNVGDRVLLIYYPANGLQYVSGNISVVSCTQIISSDAVTKSADDTNKWACDALNMQTVWRAGQYINMQCVAPLQSSPKQFYVAFDESTVSSTYPDAYLIFESDFNQAATINTSTKTVYASFDVSEVWNKTTCRGLTLHFTGYNGEQTARFEKSTEDFMPAN